MAAKRSEESFDPVRVREAEERIRAENPNYLFDPEDIEVTPLGREIRRAFRIGMRDCCGRRAWRKLEREYRERYSIKDDQRWRYYLHLGDKEIYRLRLGQFTLETLLSILYDLDVDYSFISPRPKQKLLWRSGFRYALHKAKDPEWTCPPQSTKSHLQLIPFRQLTLILATISDHAYQTVYPLNENDWARIATNLKRRFRRYQEIRKHDLKSMTNEWLEAADRVLNAIGELKPESSER